MEVYQGKSVFGGIAIGRISVHKKDEQQVKRVKIENPDREIARYRQARQTAMEQLQNLYQKALKEVGEANAAIFEIHQMMLEDDDYNESIENIIHMQQVNAEYAVASTGDNFAQMFASMEDDYMRARSADVKDISERVLSVLGGRTAGMAASEEPVIIVADDLAPSETVQLNKDLVLSLNGTWIREFPYGDPGPHHEHSGTDRHRYPSDRCHRRKTWYRGRTKRLHLCGSR